MKYEVKNYSHLKGIGKISDEAMQMHFKLYEGYVKNTNLIIEKFEFLKTVDIDYFTKFLPEWTELHRRFGWEFNGMRLHELFFDSLTAEVSENNEVGGQVKIKIEEEKNIFNTYSHQIKFVVCDLNEHIVRAKKDMVKLNRKYKRYYCMWI